MLLCLEPEFKYFESFILFFCRIVSIFKLAFYLGGCQEVQQVIHLMKDRWFRSQLRMHVEAPWVNVLNPQLSPLLRAYRCEWLCADGILQGSCRHHCMNVGLGEMRSKVLNNNRIAINAIHLVIPLLLKTTSVTFIF